MKNPWSSIDKPPVDLNVRLVDEHHPLKLFWAVDAKSRYLFAFDAEIDGLPSSKSLPKLSGIEVYLALQRTRGKLVLLLQDKVNWELFHALCSDLVRATAAIKDESAASIVIVRRLQRWQDLLKRDRPGILSPDRIKGLMGELLFLRSPLAAVFGYDAAVGAWRGPEDAPQDFTINESAIEVKCQSGGSQPVVRISSADQLSPQLPNGYLAVYTLASRTEDEPDTLTLNSLVAEIRNLLGGAAGSTRERFEDLLYMAGYVPHEDYDDYRFSLVALKSYILTKGFPRIEGADLLAGVEHVSYSIRLEACAGFQGKPDWWHSSL